MTVWLVSRRGPFGMTEKGGGLIGGPIGLRKPTETSRSSYSLAGRMARRRAREWIAARAE